MLLLSACDGQRMSVSELLQRWPDVSREELPYPEDERQAIVRIFDEQNGRALVACGLGYRQEIDELLEAVPTVAELDAESIDGDELIELLDPPGNSEESDRTE